MEENDNIVSQLQRLFSPRPDTRVSDPQTVAEAPRVAAAGLLSEDVATDAHDLTENLVPVTEQGDALDAASAQASAAEHAASDSKATGHFLSTCTLQWKQHGHLPH